MKRTRVVQRSVDRVVALKRPVMNSTVINPCVQRVRVKNIVDFSYDKREQDERSVSAALKQMESIKINITIIIIIIAARLHTHTYIFYRENIKIIIVEVEIFLRYSYVYNARCFFGVGDQNSVNTPRRVDNSPIAADDAFTGWRYTNIFTLFFFYYFFFFFSFVGRHQPAVCIDAI